jgi:hypothetical protein
MRRLTVLDPKVLKDRGIDIKAYYDLVSTNMKGILEEPYVRGIMKALNHIILKGSVRGLKGDYSGFQVDMARNSYDLIRN